MIGFEMAWVEGMTPRSGVGSREAGKGVVWPLRSRQGVAAVAWGTILLMLGRFDV